MRLTLASRLALVIALLAVVLVAASLILFYTAATMALEGSSQSQVQAAAEDKAAGLELFFRGESAALERIARDLNIVEPLTALLSNRSSAAQSVLGEELASHTVGSGAFAQALILDAQGGEVLASTDPGLLGTDLSSEPFFLAAVHKPYVQIPSGDGEEPDAIILATPITSKVGQTIGVLAGEVALGQLRAIIGANFAGGPTREVYILNADGYFLTQPRLIDTPAVLISRDGGQAALSCNTRFGSGNLIGPDYRRKVVISTFRWMPQYKICIISKVDRAEAIAPLQPVVQRLYGLGVLVLAAGVLAAILFARMITRPLSTLQRGVEAFGRGDLSQRIPVTSKDELGSLARSFNGMADAIARQDEVQRESNRLLEEAVAERTQALAHSEAINRAVVENSPVGISIRDRDLRLIYVNDAWRQIKGSADPRPSTPGSPEGHPSPSEVLAYLGENQEGVLQIYERGGAMFIPEIDIRETFPGAARWVSEYFYGILDNGGRVDSVVILTQDITARKESEQEMAAILEFSAAMRRPISRAETQAAILDHAEKIFSTEAIGLALRHTANPSIIIGDGRGAWQHWAGLQQPSTGGALSEILQTGEMIESENALADPRLLPDNLAGIPCVAVAPLSTRSQVLGVLAIGSQEPLPSSKVRLLRAISEVAAGAINRAMLFEETERRLQWLQAIRSIDRAIMGSMDVRITMNIMLEKAVTQLSMDAASVLLLRDNRLEYAFGRGFKMGLPAKVSLPLGQPQAGKAALENVPIFVGQYDPAEWQSDLMDQEGFKSYCVVPLNSKGQLLGVLEVFGLGALERDSEWMDFLQALAGLAALSLDTATLVDKVQRTNVELTMAYDVTLEGWSRSIDLRYDKLPGHTGRVVDLAMQMARAFGMDYEELVNVRRGALLHDVGTIMVPEDILLKPGKLTPEEERILHAYPTYSYEMLRSIDFLRPALDIPYCHHEKWDGSGFPRGLANIHIPFAARMFSVIEAWDSLTHNRPYRKAWSRKKALRYIEDQAGKHFDPEVVRAFLEIVG